MPWVEKDDCTGCGECVEQCPVGTIYMVDEKAEIDMTNCIRCGTCHDVCPEEAVKHDSLKIPFEVDENVAMTKKCMESCAELLGGDEERQKCLARMIKHFAKEKAVVEKTLERLEAMREK